MVDVRETGWQILIDGRTENSEHRLEFCEAHDFGRLPLPANHPPPRFRPVLSLIHTDNMDQPIAFLERNPYGNQRPCLRRAVSARRFRRSALPEISASTSAWPLHGIFPVQCRKDSLGIIHHRAATRSILH